MKSRTGRSGWCCWAVSLISIPGIEDHDPSSLRCLATGGTPITKKLQRQLQALLPGTIVDEGNGMSETVSHGSAAAPLCRYRSGFVGLLHYIIFFLSTGPSHVVLSLHLLLWCCNEDSCCYKILILTKPRRNVNLTYNEWRFRGWLNQARPRKASQQQKAIENPTKGKAAVAGLSYQQG